MQANCYTVLTANASGYIVDRQGPFCSFKDARLFAAELLSDRHYRGHQSIIRAASLKVPDSVYQFDNETKTLVKV